MKVLFLCTANSARSLLAEAIMRQFADPEDVIASAGTAPAQINPAVISTLSAMNIDTSGLRAKHLDELADSRFDYVISLCDRARHECQSDYSGSQFIAWDFPDPASNNDSQAFQRTAQELSERIRMFLLIQRKRAGQAHLFNRPEELFKVLADPLRLTMICILASGTERCVCDLVELTGMSQPKVSRHLAQLRDYGLLLDRKDQRWVYYRLNPALPDWMKKVIAATADYNPQLAVAQHSACVTNATPEEEV
ncbi:metalloregulator ArsR/SmtB family transcription factor [Pseudidiomarina sp. GXY010]|uniref:Metalloregulator ArsR/SmtB family transcription factor n=1 Tax=Pseudidiomarina fusca TaxID=2965078 RepID=A0ABU3KZC7_9GAMM|nr:metalloregulator ArsR/SmtB family transcription factor [Pseudidiomarina sp. GXY010]MDT7526687.1 metalloregulator ArsR/SmtB family transcription factor [Pseudidiomarina sp. GXY010]